MPIRAAFSVSLLCGLSSIYLTATISLYAIKKYKNQNRGDSDSGNALRDKNRLNLLLLFTLSWSILRSVVDMIIAALPCHGYITCVVYDQLSGHSFQIGSGALFLLVWLRMRWFYSHPMMDVMRTKCMKFWSIAAVILLILQILSHGPIQDLVLKTDNETTGCFIAFSENYIIYKPFINFIYLVTFQLAVLLLLITPMLRERNVSSNSTKTKIKIAVKRLSISTGVCIVVNLLASLAVYAVYQEVVLWVNIVYSLTLLLNFLAVVMSFADWQERLTFCLVERKKVVDRTCNNITLSTTM